MNKIDEIVYYVMNTPGNTNEAVLRSKLQQLEDDLYSNFYTKAETYSKVEVNDLTDYATATKKGTAKIWSTTEEAELILNIATED